MSDVRSGVTLYCANTMPEPGRKIDRFTYPADIGRLAEAFVLYDQVLLLTHDFGEVIALAYHFGESVLRELLETQSLRILYLQDRPAVVQSTPGSLHLLWMRHCSSDHPRRDDTSIRDAKDLHSFLGSRLRHYPYLPDYAGVTPEVVDLVHRHTIVSNESLTRAFSSGLERLVVEPGFLHTARKRLSLSPHFESTFGLKNGVAKLHSSLTADQSSYADGALALDLALLLELYVETVLAPLASQHTVTLSEQQLELVVKQGSGSAHGLPLEEAFQTILQVDDFPRFADAVYLEPLSGESLLALRNDPSAAALRSWLTKGSFTETSQVMLAYAKLLKSKIPRSSLAYSGLRAAASIVTGAFDSVAGVVASLGDWAYSNFPGLGESDPRVFIDGVLSSTITQCRATQRGLHLPDDVTKVIESGWNVDAIAVRLATGTEMKLSRSTGEKMNVTYGRTPADWAYVNRVLQKILDSSSSTKTLIECCHCKNKNTLSTIGRPLPPVTCRRCTNRLLPIRAP